MATSTLQAAREIAKRFGFPVLYTVGEISDILRVDNKTVRDLIHAGRLEAYDVSVGTTLRAAQKPSRTYGRDFRISEPDLRKFIDENKGRKSALRGPRKSSNPSSDIPVSEKIEQAINRNVVLMSVRSKIRTALRLCA